MDLNKNYIRKGAVLVWKKFKPGILLAFFLLAIVGWMGFYNHAKDIIHIKVGVGEAEITPLNPVGVAMAGYDRGGHLSTGVHDPLYARSIVVEDTKVAKGAVVLMTVAVVNMEESIMDEIRKGVEKQTGIPYSNVAISCTHTHSGPVLGPLQGSYAQFFIQRCVQSAVTAWKNRVPGKIGFGSTEIFGLAMNDRRMNHGGMPADPEAAIIKIENTEGKLMGVFFNFGCHPSALDLHNLLFTEDWPYYAILGIKKKVGNNVVVGYFQSAQGDSKVGYQAELSAVGAYMYGVRTYDFASKKGKIMTDAVLNILPAITTSGDLEVRSTYDHFDFPRRTTFPYTYKEALQWQQEATARLNEKQKLLGIKIGPRMLDTYKVDLWLANQAVAKSKIIESNPHPLPIRMPMQAIRIGQTVFVTFPSEVFTEIGLAVKKQSPYPNTFILGVAGDFGGYLPTKEEYLEQGYAVNGSPFSPECAGIMIKASATLIDRVSDKRAKP